MKAMSAHLELLLNALKVVAFGVLLSLSPSLYAQTTSSTTLTSSVNPSGINQNTWLTATVNGASPTGTVTFKNGSATISTATLSGGTAMIGYAFSSVGTYNLTAVYNGDAGNTASTSAPVTQVVETHATTTTVLTSSRNPSATGQTTNLGATINGGVNPFGTVTFKDGTTTIGTASVFAGTAGLSTSFATSGIHNLTAEYSGDGGNKPSTSAVLVQNVSGGSTTALTSSVNPSVLNQNTILRATVTGSSPTGSITFREGSFNLGTVAMSAGSATLTRSFATTGTKSLTAIYSGDANNSSSTSPALIQTVNGHVTSTAVTASPNPAREGDTITIRAIVTTPGVSSGNVTFRSGATVIGTKAVNTGGDPGNTATITTTLALGMHSVTASYAGDTNNQPSTSTAVSLSVRSTTTTLTLTSNANPSAVNQGVTLSATIAGGLNPNGLGVLFKEAGNNIGSATVSNGVATLARTFTTPGLFNLTAHFSGDVNNLSSSGALTQSVGPTSTALTSNRNPATLGQSVTLSATVTGAAPTGNVTFKDGAIAIATVPLSGSTASLATTFSTRGDHQITATYNGNASNAPSSRTISQRVWSSDVALSTSANPGTVGQTLTLRATIAGSNPTGTVTFRDGATSLGSATISNGTATINRSFSTAGIHTLTAVYSGDANNATATSDSVAQEILAVGGVTSGPMAWSYGYDPVGNLTSATDPNGRQTTRTHDRLDRLATVLQPPPQSGASAPSTSLTYTGQGQIATVRDPRNLTTTYTVNGLGDTTNLASPDTGATVKTFDAAGNVLTSRDARSRTTTYTYDVLGRVKTATYASGTPTAYEYDGGAAPTPSSLGRLTKITDESGNTTFTYDGSGNVLSKVQITGTKTIATSYAWGSTGASTGKLVSITYPSKVRVNYTYDTAGRVVSLAVNPPTSNGSGTDTGVSLSILGAIGYNADNAIKGWTWANNAPYIRTFDSFGRMASYPMGYPQGTGIAQGLTRTLTYDNAGRITGYTHSNAAGAQAAFDQTFGYDGLDRLIQQTTSGTTYGYAYDATGNRTSRTIGANTYSNTVAATSNRLTNVQTPGTGGVPVNNTQTYMAAGSLTGDGTTTYTYSDRGRMATSRVGSTTTTYKYNGLEQRVSKTGPLVATGAAYYAYDESGQTLGEYDANLHPVAETVYVDSTPVAVLKLTGTAVGNNLQLQVGNVYADQIDTPRVITRNADEAILWRWDGAEAFGNSPPNENPSALGPYKYNQRMPGQLFDAETNNFYNWHRDYQPKTGRYAQADPIGLAGGINPYSYVDASPLSFVDPSGLDKKPPPVFDPKNPPKPRPPEGTPEQPVPPPPPPRIPGRPSCNVVFNTCMAACMPRCPGPPAVKGGACGTVCGLAWIACKAGGGDD